MIRVICGTGEGCNCNMGTQEEGSSGNLGDTGIRVIWELWEGDQDNIWDKESVI